MDWLLVHLVQEPILATLCSCFICSDPQTPARVHQRLSSHCAFWQRPSILSQNSSQPSDRHTRELLGLHRDTAGGAVPVSLADGGAAAPTASRYNRCSHLPRCDRARATATATASHGGSGAPRAGHGKDHPLPQLLAAGPVLSAVRRAWSGSSGQQEEEEAGAIPQGPAPTMATPATSALPRLRSAVACSRPLPAR